MRGRAQRPSAGGNQQIRHQSIPQSRPVPTKDPLKQSPLQTTQQSASAKKSSTPRLSAGIGEELLVPPLPVSTRSLLSKTMDLPPRDDALHPYPTNYGLVLKKSPPSAPPGLFRDSKKRSSGHDKVRVAVRVMPDLGHEEQTPVQVDDRRKQLVIHHSEIAPKVFNLDNVFNQEAAQAEVCASVLPNVLQGVVSGSDGLIITYGLPKTGKTFTMVGGDESLQTIGVIPSAFSWLYRLIADSKSKTGTRYSIRASAFCVRNQSCLVDLLENVDAAAGEPRRENPGLLLREKNSLDNLSELRAPSVTKAAYFLDAALHNFEHEKNQNVDDTQSTTKQPHMVFTLQIYQYRINPETKTVCGGRSRLYFVDMASPEASPELPLQNPIQNSILSILNGARMQTNCKLTNLLRDVVTGGCCRSVVIAHVTADASHLSHNLNTLNFASKLHRTKARSNRKRQGWKWSASSECSSSSCDDSFRGGGGMSSDTGSEISFNTVLRQPAPRAQSPVSTPLQARSSSPSAFIPVSRNEEHLYHVIDDKEADYTRNAQQKSSENLFIAKPDMNSRLRLSSNSSAKTLVPEHDVEMKSAVNIASRGPDFIPRSQDLAKPRTFSSRPRNNRSDAISKKFYDSDTYQKTSASDTETFPARSSLISNCNASKLSLIEESNPDKCSNEVWKRRQSRFLSQAAQRESFEANMSQRCSSALLAEFGPRPHDVSNQNLQPLTNANLGVFCPDKTPYITSNSITQERRIRKKKYPPVIVPPKVRPRKLKQAGSSSVISQGSLQDTSARRSSLNARSDGSVCSFHSSKTPVLQYSISKYANFSPQSNCETETSFRSDSGIESSESCLFYSPPIRNQGRGFIPNPITAAPPMSMPQKNPAMERNPPRRSWLESLRRTFSSLPCSPMGSLRRDAPRRRHSKSRGLFSRIRGRSKKRASCKESVSVEADLSNHLTYGGRSVAVVSPYNHSTNQQAPSVAQNPSNLIGAEMPRQPHIVSDSDSGIESVVSSKHLRNSRGYRHSKRVGRSFDSIASITIDHSVRPSVPRSDSYHQMPARPMGLQNHPGQSNCCHHCPHSMPSGAPINPNTGLNEQWVDSRIAPPHFQPSRNAETTLADASQRFSDILSQKMRALKLQQDAAAAAAAAAANAEN